MAIVVEEDPFLLGVPAQRCTKLLDFIHSRVEALLVPSLGEKRKEISVTNRDEPKRTLLLMHTNVQAAAVGPCTSGPKLEEKGVMQYVFTKDNYNMGHA